MSVSKLKEILDEIDYPVLMEIVDCCWYQDTGNNYFQWNGEDSLEDLEDEDGETYSMQGFDGTYSYNGYLVANGDNGCGQTITYFFNLSKEVKF